MLRCPQCQATAPATARFCPACGTSLTESPTLTSPPVRWAPAHGVDSPRAPGTILATRYRIVGLLGRGGMGEVYRADDLKLGQPVALKFLPAAVATDPTSLARFHNEVRIARHVSHSNVCRIYDIGEADGEHFLSMEYVDGEDLASLLRRIGRLPSDKAIEIARQLCAGLAAAHEAGVLHRDLKPANVMLDGRGRVKITDFGLAEVAERVSPDEIAGTPAYMAPEQLRGAPPSVRSDIYALGLVLYEVFTGKAAFVAHSFEERARLGTDSSPPELSTAVKDIDPVVERVVLRCLEPDPARRPPTALSISAALPGGDPLAAALAAGETPSPEMVAAADVSGALRPHVAWAAFIAVICGFAFVAAVSQRTTLLNRMPHDLPPQALEVKARELLGRIAPDRAVVDSAFGFAENDEYVRFEAKHTTDDTWLEKLSRGHPPAITYWYRESPDYLVPRDSWRPSTSNPPLEHAGMSLIELDMSGRLHALTIIPPEALVPSLSPLDWQYLFDAAGLRFDQMTPATPQRRPPVFADSVFAWQGQWPGRSDLPLRVEAAALAGRPVHFAVLGPWSAQTESAEGQQPTPVDILALPLAFILIAAAALLARYNLRAGRGDRRGATRLALYVLFLAGLTFVFRAHHVPSIVEVPILGEVLSQHLLLAAIFWLAYLALEPYVRRRTPDLIISWTRLLAGQFRDPLVGRDILYGALVAGLVTSIGAVHPLLAWRLGERLLPIPGLPAEHAIDALGAIGTLAPVQLVAIQASLFMMFLFVLLTMLLRRRAFAVVVFFGVMYAFFLLLFEYRTPSGVVFAAFPATLSVIFVTRYGLLATVAFHVFLFLQEFYPSTLQLSAWYAPVNLVAFACTIALAFYGLYVCLGGRPFAGLAVLDDEFERGRSTV
jgi:predicted Ser/Thr protein kinase